MKYLISIGIISAFLLSNFVSKAQTVGCIDTMKLTKFTHPDFGNIFGGEPERDKEGNLFVNFVGPRYSLVKFNSNNEILWLKRYPFNAFSETSLSYLNAISPKADLVFIRSKGGTPYTNDILKLDSSGTQIFGKRIYKLQDPDEYFNLGTPLADAANETYLFSTSLKHNGLLYNWVSSLTAQGAIKWSKRYSNATLSNFQSIVQKIIDIDVNTIAILSIFSYTIGVSPNLVTKHGFHISKINKSNGQLITEKAFSYYTTPVFTDGQFLFNGSLNYNPSTQQFMVACNFNYSPGNRPSYALTVLDANLNPLKSARFSTNFLNLGAAPLLTISKNNLVSIIADRPAFNNSSVYYTIINEDLGFVNQQRIDLNPFALIGNQNEVKITDKGNGVLGFQLTGQPTANRNFIYLSDQSPFFQNKNNVCLGKDTAVFYIGDIGLQQVIGAPLQELADVPLLSSNITLDPYVNQPLATSVNICKEVSICDVIKLVGTKQHCLSEPLDSFKIIRNPQCMRKTEWKVDTNYVKILAQNDSTLYVKYVASYRGSIKVGFGGCTLTDEIPIEVYDTKPPVDLGKDTMHCPGQTVTFNAGAGYRSYRWQDGRQTQSYTATQPGKYTVTVIDSCGNTSSDKVEITASNARLQLTYPMELCLYDTANILLPLNLYNYNWQPTTNTLLTNKKWQLFPSASTIYTISGERFPGCILTDTVLIKVKDCPIGIFFPTAFSPNGDTRNDKYSPIVYGSLSFYEFAIYNRWGQQVFKSSVPNKGWNGKIGQEQPITGSYVWTCSYQFINAPLISKKGMFTLIR